MTQPQNRLRPPRALPFLSIVGQGLLFFSAPIALAAEDSNPLASWAPPQVAQVRSQVTSWLALQTISDPAREQLIAIWPKQENHLAPDKTLDRLAATLAQVFPEAQQLLSLFNHPYSRPEALAAQPAFQWLTDESRAPLVANNLKLLHAGWLCRIGYYDECLLTLKGVATEDVVDPAALLFYRAAAHHRLVEGDASRENAVQLLERRTEIPRRYEQLALLMQADLKGLQDDSLDHIARRMDDIDRRLELGRAGKKVREIEEGVIASLDKLIQQEEKKQQQQQQQQQQLNGNKKNPNQPMQDSQIAGGRGAGKVDRKKIGNRSGWGELPPKQRDEALQQIGREYPAHYREVVEQYLKRLATEGTTKNN